MTTTLTQDASQVTSQTHTKPTNASVSPEQNISKNILSAIGKENSVIGITGSPSTTLEISIDIKEESRESRVLGQMVYVVIKEDAQDVLVIGQVISIETKNRWHEDPAFKGVIKRHGKLPHLSGTADNRIATISVQACYNLGNSKPDSFILGTSPSTGEVVHKMTNAVMQELMKDNAHDITYMGTVYGTDVNLPFWFKHFSKSDKENKELGAGDAYHIGVFGRTGSGKTVTASYMLLGYAKNVHNLSILVLDPQSQFFLDDSLLPNNKKLQDAVVAEGMNYVKKKIITDVILPGDEIKIFTELLKNNGFIRDAFKPIYTDDKEDGMAEQVEDYLFHRMGNPGFNLNTCNYETLLTEMLTRFSAPANSRESELCEGFSKYVYDAWGTRPTRQRLLRRIEELLTEMDQRVKSKWLKVCSYFQKGEGKISVYELVEKIVKENGHFIVLDISGKDSGVDNDNIQALFVRLVENKVVEMGEELYARGERANCLIALDEAHKFISTDSPDPRIKELTKDIITAVRTTRKYSIGYMFITQTIESLSDEILRQMRIFAFGYGLTSGSEVRKVAEIVNNQEALTLYKSFIDPSSNNKFPFMFFGPVSPLSFTGSPLFLEVYKDFGLFK